MRKLASIQRIKSIKPIPDADAIEVAEVLGWKVVVKKNEFKVGDLCVYCEIDSQLPERPEFEFLRKSNFRIKTLKLRGQISQGICFPLSILKQDVDLVEGADVTEILGVVKYEPPIPAELSGTAKGKFPSFFQITDEERIQTLPNIVEQYSGKSFIATEKLDGSSCSFYWYNGTFGVCSRNWDLYESPTNTMWKFARENDIENKLKSLGRNIALQGEIIGEGIQKNKYKIKGHTVRFFRVFDIDQYQYLSYEDMIPLINGLGLETVPILDMNYILPSTIEEVLKYADGKSKLNPQVDREGVVFVRYETSNNGRLSFKAISNKFLIKNNE